MCDENLLAGVKMFRETLTFCETSRKILDIYVSAAHIIFYVKQKLDAPKSTYRHNAQIGKY